MNEFEFIGLMFYTYMLVLMGMAFYFLISFYEMIKFLIGKKIIFEVYFLILLIIIEIVKYIRLFMDLENFPSIFKIQFLILLVTVFINMKIWHNKKIETEYRENVFKVSFYFFMISNLFTYFFIAYIGIMFYSSR